MNNLKLYRAIRGGQWYNMRCDFLVCGNEWYQGNGFWFSFEDQVHDRAIRLSKHDTMAENKGGV